MKKFLKIPLSTITNANSTAAGSREIPESLDAAVLAAAALRARAIRRKRTVKRLLPAIGISITAAAAAVVAFVPGISIGTDAVQSSGVRHAPAVAAVKSYPAENIPAASAPNLQQYSAADMLALGDTTALEQENYNLAVMGEFSMDTDSFLM